MTHSPSIELSLSAGFCISSAVLLLILPLRWIIAAVLAAALHEGCHILALQLCGIRIYGLTIGSGGAVLKTESMNPRAELLCALAGPAGSLLLLLLLRRAPVLALCGGIQGLYNLLPVYPSDGGRALGCVLQCICPNQADRIMGIIRTSMAVLLILIGLYGFYSLKLGYGVLILTFFLLMRLLPGKTPCKAA